MSGIVLPSASEASAASAASSTASAPKVRIGVLGSTRGTDLQALLDAVAAETLNAEILMVISDRRQAYILERARHHNIPALWISPYNDSAPGQSPAVNRCRITREQYDSEISSILTESGAEIVLLIGWMRILSAQFCRKWENRVLNVHPSLLPDFAGGMDGDVHRAVIDAGRRESGCTVHLVTPELDSGPIIIQKRCQVLSEDTPETLKQRIQALEGEALIEAVRSFQKYGRFSTPAEIT